MNAKCAQVIEARINDICARMMLPSRWLVPGQVLSSAIGGLLNSTEIALQDPVNDAKALWAKVQETECLSNALVTVGIETIFTFSETADDWYDLVDRITDAICHSSDVGSIIDDGSLLNDADPDEVYKLLCANAWLVFLLLVGMFDIGFKWRQEANGRPAVID